MLLLFLGEKPIEVWKEGMITLNGNGFKQNVPKLHHKIIQKKKKISFPLFWDRLGISSETIVLTLVS